MNDSDQLFKSHNQYQYYTGSMNKLESVVLAQTKISVEIGSDTSL